jgi:hypothetical protein
MNELVNQSCAPELRRHFIRFTAHSLVVVDNNCLLWLSAFSTGNAIIGEKIEAERIQRIYTVFIS